MPTGLCTGNSAGLQGVHGLLGRIHYLETCVSWAGGPCEEEEDCYATSKYDLVRTGSLSIRKGDLTQFLSSRESASSCSWVSEPTFPVRTTGEVG